MKVLDCDQEHLQGPRPSFLTCNSIIFFSSVPSTDACLMWKLLLASLTQGYWKDNPTWWDLWLVWQAYRKQWNSLPKKEVKLIQPTFKNKTLTLNASMNILPINAENKNERLYLKCCKKEEILDIQDSKKHKEPKREAEPPRTSSWFRSKRPIWVEFTKSCTRPPILASKTSSPQCSWLGFRLFGSSTQI